MIRSLMEMPLSDHFKALEFACQGTECCCHGAVNVDEELVAFLEEFRMELGVPIRVNSGFRCDEHNKSVGGHPRSFHRLGMAADVTAFKLREDLEGWAIKGARMLAERVGEERGNVIFYPKQNFIHFDVGHRISDLVRKKTDLPPGAV